MFYINDTVCISPQNTFSDINIEILKESENNFLKALEPIYDGLPHNALRRMSKSVRIALGASLLLIERNTQTYDGIIIGSGNGSMEETGKFLDQLIEYNEGMLTPGNFVQSSPNAIAGQISLLTKNKNYNITHVHKGLAFENAMLDVAMLLKENPSNHYLMGGVDETSSYHYQLDDQEGWYKNETISNNHLYETGSEGSIAGEGAAMFILSNNKENSLAKLQSFTTVHTSDKQVVKEKIQQFLSINLPPEEKIDLFISGENGDERLLKYYLACENLLENEIASVRFKHMSGEYSTASAFALWLACNVLGRKISIPKHCFKNKTSEENYKNILIYNIYKGEQHSLMLVKELD